MTTAAPSFAGAKPSPGSTVLPGDFAVITWALTTAVTTGDAVEYTDYADRSVQFSGGATWGSATAALEGSNDGVLWSPLTDPQGNAISKTADALEQVEEMTRYVRAKLTTAGTAAAVTVNLFVKGGR